jgi:stage V sporulation protein D (sporulation-specific penicillin-binding protein)
MHVEYTVISTKKRLLAIIFAITFFLFVLVFRLGYLQLIAGRYLQSKAIDQWTRDLPITAKRGTIYDTTGAELVNNNTSYTVYFRANAIDRPEEVAKYISDILENDYENIYKKAVDTSTSEIMVVRKLTTALANDIRRQGFNGVYFAEDITRNYVYGDFLTQVLGYTSIDNVGQSGVEGYYDRYLRGLEGEIMTETDLRGVPLPDGKMSYTPAIDGLSLFLTIDRVIQQITENVLNLIMKVHNPAGASAIVMNPNTGEILAMGSKPGYDLNSLPRDDIARLLKDGRNKLIMDVYEPGSTFKVLTTSANIEEALKGNPKAFKSDYVFKNNANFRQIDDKKIKCWTNHNNGKHNDETLAMALNNSCNPIFTDIAMSLGKNTFYKYIDAFGYGKKSGIDFTGEGTGILVPEKLVTNGDLARIGFGQSIAVTPLQLINATAAAINGGLLMEPHLVRAISTYNNVAEIINPVVKNRAISAAASKAVREMMQDVVTNGSGKQCYIPGYEVGGKTGTAQKFENGAIAEGKYVSSFVGFMPASNPQYIILIVVDEPVGQNYGSIVAAPYAKLILEQIIQYKNLKPIK